MVCREPRWACESWKAMGRATEGGQSARLLVRGCPAGCEQFVPHHTGYSGREICPAWICYATGCSSSLSVQATPNGTRCSACVESLSHPFWARGAGSETDLRHERHNLERTSYTPGVKPQRHARHAPLPQ